jgi:NAD(P)-dependent dehydrogenase (short-subunit alcohol dehydrogenase family)
VTLLSGRVAVITGASRGIGLATAESLADQGATVVRLARSLTDGARGRFSDLRCDLADGGEIERASARILEEWGPPAIVVQNAGAFVLKTLEATAQAEFDQVIALNVRAPFLLARQLLPAMRAVRSGIHITIGSISDHTGYPENSAYTASKFGVRGLHEALEAEYRGSGVRFTLISPGPTDTAVWDPVDPDSRPGFLPRSSMLRCEDVAEAVLFAATRPPRATVEWLRLMPSGAGEVRSEE